ncbi:hypothetical protein BZA05DRAFT_422690 [Tricharina praecox]|uniref:uncharacterized protein n=1 Tax=Tricharina praecox TaxID=43433 RepID=UPI00221ED068|nr:uncharacterized protein BZA05DRAFT_422690 [Tricharina praecox]KAI5842001.1 hypothetical protein BZA05DRAFT_422690 [Tricharina praecox]
MTKIFYYDLIGVAHFATHDQILAVIELAMEAVMKCHLSVDLLRTAMHVLLSPERREAHDRRQGALCPKWFKRTADSPLADKGSSSLSFSEVPPDVSEWIKVPCRLRSLVAKRKRKGRTISSRPPWEAADTKRGRAAKAAKERLVLQAGGATTVDAICGCMGWTVGGDGRGPASR